MCWKFPHETDLVNISTALEFLLLTALGNFCMEAPMEEGGSSSASTEVWLANLLKLMIKREYQGIKIFLPVECLCSFLDRDGMSVFKACRGGYAIQLQLTTVIADLMLWELENWSFKHFQRRLDSLTWSRLTACVSTSSSLSAVRLP